jgi:hypothetical protein
MRLSITAENIQMPKGFTEELRLNMRGCMCFSVIHEDLSMFIQSESASMQTLEDPQMAIFIGRAYISPNVI